MFLISEIFVSASQISSSNIQSHLSHLVLKCKFIAPGDEIRIDRLRNRLISPLFLAGEKEVPEQQQQQRQQLGLLSCDCSCRVGLGLKIGEIGF